MKTVIEVEALSDRQPSGFGHLRLFHQGCDQVPLVKHRNPITAQYTIQCVCGLTIRLPVTGPAIDAFDLTAIDEQARVLPTGSYTSSAQADLEVVGKSAA